MPIVRINDCNCLYSLIVLSDGNPLSPISLGPDGFRFWQCSTCYLHNSCLSFGS